MDVIRLTKNQRLRERMQVATKNAKQTTLENPLRSPGRSIKPEQEKSIEITHIQPSTKEDELTLRNEFKLSPSRAAFSRVTCDLFFNEEILDSRCISIPQSSLGGNDFEFSSVLDMKGIAGGPHSVRVEMHELWSSQEKLTKTLSEVTEDYVRVRMQDSWIKVPTVKSIAGTDLIVVSDHSLDIYREMEECRRREHASKRDQR